jgi:phosphoribosylglycinamide formyltransferase-1
MTYLLDRILEGFGASPRLGILMSGEGSNARALLEQRHRYPQLDFDCIVTDRKSSKALHIAEEHRLDYAYIPGSVRTVEARSTLFGQISNYLRIRQVDFLIYAGFMKISTPEFCREFPGINTHPADLSLRKKNGKPRYTGMPVIEEALEAGESYLASTVHVVDAEVDCGHPIAISKHLKLHGRDRSQPRALHQELKTQCEHHSYPKTLELLAHGALTKSELPLKLEGSSHD